MNREVASLHEWNADESVDLAATLRDGRMGGIITVSLSDSAAGVYTVSAVTISSSSTVVLGDLTAKKPFSPLWVGPAFGAARFGTKTSPFPAGFNPFDVAAISVSDSNGNLVSTTALDPVPAGFYSAISPITSSTAAPRAHGYALIRAAGPPPPESQPADTGGSEDSGGPTIGSAGGSSLTIDGGGTGGSIDFGSEYINIGTIPTGAGSFVLAGGDTYTGSTTINGGTLFSVGSYSAASPPALSSTGVYLSGSGVSFVPVLNLNPGYGSGSITLGTLPSLNGPPILVGVGNLVLLTSSASGSVILPNPQFSGSATGTLTFGDGSGYSGGVVLSTGTLTLTDSNSYVAGTPATSGTLAFSTGGNLVFENSLSVTVVSGYTPPAETFSMLLERTAPVTQSRSNSESADELAPVTGELVLHVLGLPARTTLTYAVDGADLGTATTTAGGILGVRAIQGGAGTLSATVDLYSIHTVTVHDGAGDVLATAQF